MDGGKEVDFKGEDKILIPSPKVATYDLQPEMSAVELTDKVLERLADFDVVLMNYANPDMVGHTGIIEAAIKAVETVSEQASRIFDKVQELGGVFMLTADHGNAEQMLDENDKP
jgi:2,3-bisphosphoglycerate-independent phosphoglycerate mutase